MSWASRRRTVYLSGVILFFLIVVGGPLAYLGIRAIPPPCAAGTMRPAGLVSGPCSQLDPQFLQPNSVLWSRSFQVRDGSYTAVAYLENPNPDASVQIVHYQFGLYDSTNILIAERSGTTYLMPGGITPVLETGIDTGNRAVVHTYFEITDGTLVWTKSSSPAQNVKINDQSVSNETSMPQVDAQASDASLDTMRNVRFVAVVFDPSGNAFAASGTKVLQLDPNSPTSITFTWPEPFAEPVGRIDIIPLLPPVPSSLGSL